MYMTGEEGKQIIRFLLLADDNESTAIIKGLILRECFHHSILLQYPLFHFELLHPLFQQYANTSNVNIRRDLLLSLQELLIDHEECGNDEVMLHVYLWFIFLIRNRLSMQSKHM